MKQWLTWFHIASGALSLFSGLMAMVSAKGKRNHRAWGKVYTLAMTAVFISAMILSVWTGNIFLFVIGIFSYYNVWLGWRSYRNHKVPATPLSMNTDKAVEIFALLAHLFMIYLAGVIFFKGSAFGLVPLAFGVFGARLNLQALKRIRTNSPLKKFWINAHIGGMTGSFIAAVTAFLVNNPMGIPLILAWFLPSIFLVPLLIYWTKKYGPRTE